ncbi:MAG: DUF3810 domain-containing protein [Lachnospiraceae bacterium]|nr:DUF3810 domain-containing protein [Lachnospiraceae bacterium]
MEKKNRSRISKYPATCLVLTFLIISLNLLAVCFKGFSDWHVKKIFPLAVNTLGRFFGAFPVAVGDIFIGVMVLLILTGLLMLIVSAIFKGRILKVTIRLWKVLLMVWLVAWLELTVNWTMLYHTTSLREAEVPSGREYTNKEYAAVYNYVVQQLNTLAGEALRNEDGIVISNVDVNAEAKKMLTSLADKYPMLAGYYPDPKDIYFANIFSQRGILGYYMPVTIESNINPLMNDINDPVTVCHELSHLKGYMREDEANFIAIIACMNSSEPFFRYSGFILAYDYLSGSFPVESGLGRLAVDERVIYDDVFISNEKWVEIEKSSPLPTSVVKEVSDKLIDNSLKINGVEEGIGSYGEVVTLLLHYFLDR